MKTKALNISSLLVVVAFLLFSGSCDKIEEPYLHLTNQDTTITGGNDTLVPDVRKILLEEFTGHKCPNCPGGAEEAQSLKARYGQQLIVMAIHSGFDSEPDATGDFTYDFRTVEGGQIHDFYNAQFYPSGIVNRIKPEGASNITLFKSSWDGAIADLVDLPQQASIKITAQYTASTGKLEVSTETEFLEDLTGTFHITVFVVENGIIKPQKDLTSTIYNYEHNHVLRTSMNGAFGTPVGGTGSGMMGMVTDNFTITMDEEWVVENCEVIAVIHQQDHATRGIVQAEKKKLNP
jgi:hypothetical protein